MAEPNKGGRPALPPEEALVVKVEVKVTRAQKAALQRWARAQGYRDLSTAIRLLLHQVGAFKPPEEES